MMYGYPEDYIHVDDHALEVRYLEAIISDLKEQIVDMQVDIDFLEGKCQQYAERIQELENEEPV